MISDIWAETITKKTSLQGKINLARGVHYNKMICMIPSCIQDVVFYK